MILYPNAKINIGLDILKKRNDGFHELETIMYPVGLNDILTINHTNKNELKFTATGIAIDGNPEDNLILKAYHLISNSHNIPPLEIHLHKSIPFGAGLGGGSADCAFTITGINQLCNLGMSTSEMEGIAAELGSDCPFFINNTPALAKGRGEKLSPITLNLNKYYFAIIIPPIPISTKLAYSKVKPAIPDVKLENKITSDIKDWRNMIKNDFEASVFPEFPEIEKIKETLYKHGADYASLSGSGSAVFGIFNENPKIKHFFPDNYFIWTGK